VEKEMSEMVERVAIAIAGRDAWDELDHRQKIWHRTVARDAIAAMREPTKAMVAACGVGEIIGEPAEVAEGFWQAMIDEALK
jgi:hypothetical protein